MKITYGDEVVVSYLKKDNYVNKSIFIDWLQNQENPTFVLKINTNIEEEKELISRLNGIGYRCSILISYYFCNFQQKDIY